MKFILYYILLGGVLMFLVEAFVNGFSKGIEDIDRKAPSFDWFTRVFTIIFWPYQVYILVEGLFNHND